MNERITLDAKDAEYIQRHFQNITEDTTCKHEVGLCLCYELRLIAVIKRKLAEIDEVLDRVEQ